MVDGAPAGDQPLSLAVVGDGPKALFALEELCAQLSDAARHDSLRALEITVVAPGPLEGTGAAYDAPQPPSLRLHAAAALLDVPAPWSASTSMRGGAGCWRTWPGPG